MTFLDNIEALAKALDDEEWYTADAIQSYSKKWIDKPDAAFMSAITPAAVLAMAAVCKAAIADITDDLTPPGISPTLDALRSAIEALDALQETKG
jgi:hypothetical protein